ncbi:aldehyde dehydrogenase family protein [Burkholderia sp. Bp8963]|uniref:aldehyde dehydrogenase family protein n=1 Tax=Burkholderia sp. Bp8963 TaxID=2184547 RepID=UPI000F5A607A|nr:aldehyde dehydrogenase family protein [Burkholderia sp. Bp8963]RQS67442.1 aldehyde dehydrogenase family protein [Burkholderia sp. Bp8963]
MTKDARLLIDGKLVDADRHLEVIDPATGRAFATVPRGDHEQVAAAVAAAKRAQPGWAALPMIERSALLERVGDLLRDDAEAFARALVSEQGKPLQEARQEAQLAEHFVRYLARLELPVETVQDDASYRIDVHRKPLGVVAAITAWNFPLLIAAYKLAPALLTGNTVVLKPAPTTPITALMLGARLADLLPAGVVNVVTDANDLGPVLTAHPDVAKISFTGSTVTGKKVMESAGPKLKRVTLELGGNDAAIVLDDVDVEATAAKLFASAFYNCGQVCLALKRVYAPAALYDRLCEAIAEHARNAVVGNGLDASTTHGPVQNAMQFEKARRFLAVAREGGAIVAGGGTREGGGYFVLPTIVRDLDDANPLVAEEQFSPILPILRYEHLDDALARANATPYGLGGSVWSGDEARAIGVAKQLQVGTAWVNHHLHFGPHIPLVGAKESGLGVEFTSEGLAEYTQTSVLSIAH